MYDSPGLLLLGANGLVEYLYRCGLLLDACLRVHVLADIEAMPELISTVFPSMPS